MIFTFDHSRSRDFDFNSIVAVELSFEKSFRMRKIFSQFWIYRFLLSGWLMLTHLLSRASNDRASALNPSTHSYIFSLYISPSLISFHRTIFSIYLPLALLTRTISIKPFLLSFHRVRRLLHSH